MPRPVCVRCEANGVRGQPEAAGLYELTKPGDDSGWRDEVWLCEPCVAYINDLDDDWQAKPLPDPKEASMDEALPTEPQVSKCDRCNREGLPTAEYDITGKDGTGHERTLRQRLCAACAAISGMVKGRTMSRIPRTSRTGVPAMVADPEPEPEGEGQGSAPRIPNTEEATPEDED